MVSDPVAVMLWLIRSVSVGMAKDLLVQALGMDSAEMIRELGNKTRQLFGLNELISG